MDAEPQTKQGQGLYDLAIFVAKSFGRSLPVVVIIVVIAIGAWYYIRELSTLQAGLIEAREKASTAHIEQIKAEAAAQTAINKARVEIMSEQAKRLDEINETSIAVSKKIQELVKGQLDNMTLLETRSAAQARFDEKHRDELENEAKKNILSLKKQVKELEDQRNDLVEKNAISSYTEVRSKVIEELDKPYFIESGGIFDLLRQKLTVPEIKKIADTDAHDKNLAWRYRMLLLVELYRMTDKKDYADALEHLLQDNSQLLDSNTGQILQSNLKWPKDAAIELTRIAFKWILNDSATVDVRFSFLNGIGYSFANTYIDSLDQNERELTAKKIAKMYLANTKRSCFQPLELLYRLSKNSAITVAYIVKEDSQNQVTNECIGSELSAWGNPPSPTKEMRKIWGSQ